MLVCVFFSLRGVRQAKRMVATPLPADPLPVEGRVRRPAKLKMQSPAVTDILSFMGYDPPFEVKMTTKKR